jgi:hypothetical protein
LAQALIILKRVQTRVKLKINLNGQFQKGQGIGRQKINGNLIKPMIPHQQSEGNSDLTRLQSRFSALGKTKEITRQEFSNLTWNSSQSK